MEKLYKKSLFILLLIYSGLACADDHKEIRQVIASFGKSITQKNETAFLSLFIPENVSWIGVFSTQEYQKYLASQGVNSSTKESEIPSKLHASTPQEFIQWLAKLDGTPRETFENVKIVTDGEIATVFFDYEFFLGEQRQNWGSESWMMVKTRQGWKIQAVNFSFTRDEKATI